MERCADLEALTRQLYEAVSQGDITYFERHLSRGESCVVIGTEPEEWWNDYHAVLEAMRAQMKTAKDAVRLIASNLSAYRHGDVGWVSDRPKLRLGRVEVPCRHTSVFMKEDGEWRIVQHHFSIGVTNEDAFGAEAGKLG
jgi:hypothetical protein